MLAVERHGDEGTPRRRRHELNLVGAVPPVHNRAVLLAVALAHTLQRKGSPPAARLVKVARLDLKCVRHAGRADGQRAVMDCAQTHTQDASGQLMVSANGELATCSPLMSMCSV